MLVENDEAHNMENESQIIGPDIRGLPEGIKRKKKRNHDENIVYCLVPESYTLELN